MTTHADLIARLREFGPCIAQDVQDALESLEQQVAALTEQRDRAEQQVKELLWDDPVEPSFGPAFGDLLVYLNHQTPHPTEIYQMMADGAKLWQQMKDQVAALTKGRDELEISNAFAHGEWRAVKDQLAALTKEREQYLADKLVEEPLRRLLAAAQAREAKLRSVLQWVLRASDLSLKEIGAYMVENGIASMPASEGTAESFSALQAVREAIALPTDDSALMERLKQERERICNVIDLCLSERQRVIIRSMK